MTPFAGFPDAAFEFYAELEHNNNRNWWLEHKATYESAVKEPLAALLAGLEPQFGEARLFRPNRDIRFSTDKSPYKTAQGAVAAVAEGMGFYVQLDADGLLIGGGYHISTPAQLARFRSAVDAPSSGGVLQEILADVEALGFEVEGESLKTVPRGFAKDHPRAELLKYKSLAAGTHVGRPGWLCTPEAEGEVAKRWEGCGPWWSGPGATPRREAVAVAAACRPPA